MDILMLLGEIGTEGIGKDRCDGGVTLTGWGEASLWGIHLGESTEAQVWPLDSQA